MKRALVCVLAFVGVMMSGQGVQGKQVFADDFSKGKWSLASWDMVKSWRWDYMGEWVQQDDHIVNKVPLEATGPELEGERCGETYTSMVLKQPFSGKTTFSCTMSFDYRMAPGVILTVKDPVKDKQGRWEFRDNLELVLYDQGINVWHHYFDQEGKQHWRLKAFLRAPYKARTPYDFKVTVEQEWGSNQLTIQCNGQTLGYLELDLPKAYRIGIVASEGSNRFYDFKVWKD